MRPSSVVVDGTLGLGGHAEAILERLGPEGRLIGFDKDPAAIEKARERLNRFGKRLMIIRDDFKNMAGRLRESGTGSVDGVLLDLGVSSMQLADGARGFSFLKDGPLDMRMDPQNPRSAADIVNRSQERELTKILWDFGEERYARRIAERIVSERSKTKISTTGQLERAIFHAVPKAARYGRVHPATRSFQALRIVVNDELGSLKAFLSAAVSHLSTGGRAVIISFHSLEDRIVKRAFREWEAQRLGRALTKKPVVPGRRETNENPRSRSAKLRAFVKE